MVRLLYLLGIGLGGGAPLVSSPFQPVIHIEPGVPAGVQEYLGGCSGILRCIVVQEFDTQVCRYFLQPPAASIVSIGPGALERRDWCTLIGSESLSSLCRLA